MAFFIIFSYFCNPMMDGEGKGKMDGNHDVYETNQTNGYSSNSPFLFQFFLLYMIHYCLNNSQEFM